MRAVVLVLWVCTSAWLAGCPGGGDDDDDTSNESSANPKPTQTEPDPVVEPGSRKLSVTNTQPVRLSVGATVKIRGRLLDTKDNPVDEVPVSFALIGRVQDSSIGTLDSITDADGIFENELLAGQIPTTFRLRVTSPGAAPFLADVAVSAAGFGTLLVTAAYDGDRLVTQRSVFAEADAKCTEVQRTSADRTATFSPDETQARLAALPAATRYAVTALAQGAAGTLLAQGCVDDVEIKADSAAKVEIALVDEGLMPAGDFALAAELDAKAPASALATALFGAAQSLVVGDGSDDDASADPEAGFLLDAFDSALRSDDGQPEWPTLADAIAQDRAMLPEKETPDHDLQGRLELDNQGPLLAIARMAKLAQAVVEPLRVTGELSLTGSASAAATFQPLRIEALASEVGQKPMAIDLSQQKSKVSIHASFMSSDDTLLVSSVSFRPQLGALTSLALRALTSVEAPGHGEEIRDLLGCSALGDWLHDQTYSSRASCDEDCIAEACEVAVARLLNAAQDGLTDVDDARRTWTLSGVFVMVDKNGDLLADQMTCDMFSGQWPAADGKGKPAEFRGDASASAIVPKDE